MQVGDRVQVAGADKCELGHDLGGQLGTVMEVQHAQDPAESWVFYRVVFDDPEITSFHNLIAFDPVVLSDRVTHQAAWLNDYEIIALPAETPA